MTVRIERLETGGATELRIEGDPVGEAVEVVGEELRGLGGVEDVSLDVSGVRLADRHGAGLLYEARRGAHPVTAL